MLLLNWRPVPPVKNYQIVCNIYSIFSSQETADHPNWNTSAPTNDNFAAIVLNLNQQQQRSDVCQATNSVEDEERCTMNGHKVVCRIDNNNRPEFDDSPEDDVYMEEGE